MKLAYNLSYKNFETLKFPVLLYSVYELMNKLTQPFRIYKRSIYLILKL